MRVGIHAGVTNADYHAAAGLSRSRLVPLVDGTPLDFHCQEPVEETASMRLGTAAHLAILEPGHFESLVRPQPKWDLRTNVGKKARDEWREANPGCIGVPEEDYAIACEAAAVVRAKKGPATALREGRAELSMAWEHGPQRTLLKSRPDFLDLQRGVAVDVKVTQRGLEDADVVRILVDYHAALQAAMVSAGVLALTEQPVSTYLLVVRLRRPVDMRLVHVGGTAAGEPLGWLEYGEAQLARALRRYHECVAKNEWPGWSDRGVTSVEPPVWVKNRTESMIREAQEESPRD